MAEQGFEVICLLCNPISISNPVRHATLSSHEPGDPERERGRRWGRHIAGVRVSRRPRAELHHIKPYFLSLIVLMLSKCHYVWHGSQSLRDCSTVLSLYLLTQPSLASPDINDSCVSCNTIYFLYSWTIHNVQAIDLTYLVDSTILALYPSRPPA